MFQAAAIMRYNPYVSMPESTSNCSCIYVTCKFHAYDLYERTFNFNIDEEYFTRVSIYYQFAQKNHATIKTTRKP